MYYIQLKTIRIAHFSRQVLLFRCRCSMGHVRDMTYPHRRVANVYSWDRFRAAHACFYTRYVTWFVLYSTQDHQNSSLFTSVTAISLQVQHQTCARYCVSTSACGKCIHLGSIWGSSCMFYTRCVTWFVLYWTQDHQNSSLFTSGTAISLQVQHETCARYDVSTSLCGKCIQLKSI